MLIAHSFILFYFLRVTPFQLLYDDDEKTEKYANHIHAFVRIWK